MHRSRKGLALLALPALMAGAAAMVFAVVPTEPVVGPSPLVRSQEHFDAGRFRDAERLLVDHPSAEARWLRARCYVAQGLLEDARDTLEGLTDRPEAARLLVKVCLDRGDFARAAPHLRRMSSQDPENAALLKLLAHCESKSGNSVAALAAANQALALDPADAETGRLVADLASAVSARFSLSSPPAPSSRSFSPLSPSSSLHPTSGIRHPQSPQKELRYGPRPR